MATNTDRSRFNVFLAHSIAQAACKDLREIANRLNRIGKYADAAKADIAIERICEAVEALWAYDFDMDDDGDHDDEDEDG